MKFLHRRQFLHLAAGAAALPTLPHTAQAQAYPSRPVRIIVPAAVGGASDILARLIDQRLTERLRQTFVIENRQDGDDRLFRWMLAAAIEEQDRRSTVLLMFARHRSALTARSPNPASASLQMTVPRSAPDR